MAKEKSTRLLKKLSFTMVKLRIEGINFKKIGFI